MGSIDLSGQTAVVTGAGRGIGERIADRFAEAGANVVAAARTESEIRDTAERVEAEYGVDGVAVPTDLRRHADVEALVAATREAFGVPELLVNNAGVNLAGPILDKPIDDVDEMLHTNLRGTFLLTQRWAQAFRDSDRTDGRVVNVSSATSHVGVSRMTLYGGTNAGITAVTRGFAAGLAGDGITVNAVTPGLIGIDRIERLVEAQGDDIYDLDRIPLDRLGDPYDVADACLFFASDLAGYVTGAELVVDGGVEFTAGLYR